MFYFYLCRDTDLYHSFKLTRCFTAYNYAKSCLVTYRWTSKHFFVMYTAVNIFIHASIFTYMKDSLEYTSRGGIAGL